MVTVGDENAAAASDILKVPSWKKTTMATAIFPTQWLVPVSLI